MWEITLNGQMHSGSFETEQAAKNRVAEVQNQFPGGKVEVKERTSDATDGSRYAGRDANGLPVTSVPADAQAATQAGGQQPGAADRPGQGMLPGPGGAVQTEQVSTEGAKPMVEGKNPSQAPKK